jgi:hypothetical protein
MVVDSDSIQHLPKVSIARRAGACQLLPETCRQRGGKDIERPPAAEDELARKINSQPLAVLAWPRPKSACRAHIAARHYLMRNASH